MRMIYTIPEIPPSNNKYLGRKNVWEYREAKKRWVDLVALFCRPRPDKPIERAKITLRYYFPKRVRRDPDNYSGKMILDGLVRCGIIQDDSFDRIELVLQCGGYDSKNPRVEIEVDDLHGESVLP